MTTLEVLRTARWVSRQQRRLVRIGDWPDAVDVYRRANFSGPFGRLRQYLPVVTVGQCVRAFDRAMRLAEQEAATDPPRR